jgi:hypothetical protein
LRAWYTAAGCALAFVCPLIWHGCGHDRASTGDGAAVPQGPILEAPAGGRSRQVGPASASKDAATLASAWGNTGALRFWECQSRDALGAAVDVGRRLAGSK